MNANNIPAGFVLVPREPTREMKLAGAFAPNHRTSEAVWRAMIASAPSTADLVAHETPNASDNGACVQPASGEVAEAGQVEANLEGLADLWDQSALDTASTASWNEYQKGLAEGLRQASRDLRSSLAATPASPQAPAPQAVVGEASEPVTVAVEQMVESVNGVSWWVVLRRGKHRQDDGTYGAAFKNRAEWHAAGLRWILGQGEKPNIRDFMDEPAALTPSPAPSSVTPEQRQALVRGLNTGKIQAPAPSAAPHQGADALREALTRLESAVDWHLGRSGFTQSTQLKGTAHGEAVRKELYAAHDAARAALAHHQAPQQGEPK